MRRTGFASLIFILYILSGCHHGGADNTGSVAGDSTRLRLENLNRQIAADGSNAGLYNQRARFYIGDKQMDMALKDINKALSLEPGNSSLFITLSDIYLLMGQPQNCRENLTKAISLNPKGQEGLLKMAKLLLIMKDYQGCYENIRQLLLIDKNNFQAYYTRALALLEQGDTNRAIGDLMISVDQNQDFFDGYIQLGELFALHKDPKAASYLKNALHLRPTSKEALYTLGMYYQETEQFGPALDVYQTLAKTDTTLRSAPFNMGYINLVYLRDFPKAITFFTDALKRDPAYYEAWFNRGYAYELSGNYPKAYDDYQKALKIKVNYEKAVTGLNRLDKLRR